MAATLEQVNTAIQDVMAHLEALPKGVTDEAAFKQAIADVVKEMLTSKDPDVARNMRFGNDGDDSRMAGSKYARHNMSASDVEFLHDLMSSCRGKSLKGRGDASFIHPGPSEELDNVYKSITTAIYMPESEVMASDRKAIDDLYSRVPKAWLSPQDRAIAARWGIQSTKAYRDAYKAMDTAESGYGSQIVGAQYVGELWDAARKLGEVMPLIQQIEMTAPTSYIPIEADLPELLFVAENTASPWTSNLYTTVKTGSNRATLTAKKFVIYQLFSGEMEEDSIIPFIPFLRAQIVSAMAYYGDSLVLNGDTTNAATGNINLDDADPADTKHYLAFDGIRHAPLVDVTTNDISVAGLPTWGLFMNLRRLMVDRTYLIDWGHPKSPDDLIYVAGPETADAICGAVSEVITVNHYADNAVVLTGEVGHVGRNRLISSIAMPLTEADGKVSTTASNNTLGQLLAVNLRGFKLGIRRRVKIETDRIAGADQTSIILSTRLAFGRYQPSGAVGSIEAAACGRNITVSV